MTAKKLNLDQLNLDQLSVIELDVYRWARKRASDDYDGDVAGPLRDLASRGCQSGIVSHLIYYRDTRRYWRGRHEAIWEYLLEVADNYGVSLGCLVDRAAVGAMDSPKATDLECRLAWLCWDLAARSLLGMLESE